jgi:hypothetical protein
MKLELRNNIKLYSVEDNHTILIYFKQTGYTILGKADVAWDSFIWQSEPYKNYSGYKAYKFRMDLAKELRAYKKIGYIEMED